MSLIGAAMKEKEIKQFEKVQNQLECLHSEISVLSKKTQNDGLNKFKLKLVNQVLADANKILGSIFKPFSDFETFNEDDLPSNSDATIVISQYLACMENLRVENIHSKVDYTSSGKIDKIFWYWNDIEKETYPPKNIS